MIAAGHPGRSIVHASPDSYRRDATCASDVAVTADAVSALAERGFAVEPDWLGRLEVRALRARLLALDRQGALAPAAVGRGKARAVEPAIRGDRIHWLDAVPGDAAERGLLASFESLRLLLNRELELGLFDFEAHYAHYPAGAGYARHCDRFRDDDARVLSCVVYLNDVWRVEDGGALRIYPDPVGMKDVVPVGGTLVLLWSDRIAHAVLPARRSRYSVAGWFRRRAA
jgi:SM-20-related protein